jgi:hypothetical protein
MPVGYQLDTVIREYAIYYGVPFAVADKIARAVEIHVTHGAWLSTQRGTTWKKVKRKD